MKNKNFSQGSLWVSIMLAAFTSFIILLSGCKKDDNTIIDTGNNINTGKEWKDLGSMNINKNVLALCSDPSGNIYASGFTDANDLNYVLKWNGSTWSIVGDLRSKSAIYCLSSDLSGNIYASGQIYNPAETYSYVAKWDGSTWTDIGLHSNYGDLIVSATDKTGKLYATTDKSSGADVNVYSGGNSWTNLGSLNYSQDIASICADGAGKIYEVFGISLYPPVIAMHKNGAWTELPALTSQVRELRTSCIDKDGNFYVAGDVYDPATNKFYVGKWNGSSWTKLGDLNGGVFSLATDPAGNLYAGGSMSPNGPTKGMGVVKWDGSKWVALGTLDSKINSWAICTDPSGAVYAGGSFGSTYKNLVKVFK